MMELQWTRRALTDLERLYEFLAPASPRAAALVVQALVDTPTRLLRHPRLGKRLDEFDPREVRRILAGRYEIRYELTGATIYVLRLWHTREDR